MSAGNAFGLDLQLLQWLLCKCLTAPDVLCGSAWQLLAIISSYAYSLLSNLLSLCSSPQMAIFVFYKFHSNMCHCASHIACSVCPSMCLRSDHNLLDACVCYNLCMGGCDSYTCTLVTVFSAILDGVLNRFWCSPWETLLWFLVPGFGFHLCMLRSFWQVQIISVMTL